MLCNEGCGRAPDFEMSPNATGFTCAYCVVQMVAPPPPPVNSALSVDEKVARKKAREERKALRLEKAKAGRGRLRGWHKKALFEFDEKFYSYGKEIDAIAAAKLRRELKDAPLPSLVRGKGRGPTAAKAPNSAAGKGRGWHLKKAFTHEGKFYSFGAEVTEKEFQKLVKR